MQPNINLIIGNKVARQAVTMRQGDTTELDDTFFVHYPVQEIEMPLPPDPIGERLMRVLKQFDFDGKFELRFDHDEWVVCLATPHVTLHGRGDTPALAVKQIVSIMDNWPAHFTERLGEDESNDNAV